MKSIQAIAAGNRWVIKVGSALLTDDGRGLDHAAIASWAKQIAALRESGKEVILVSSGAVAEGMNRLGWTTRPRELFALQAAAAVGQMGLVQAYESAFQQHGLHTAQVLLTHDDLTNRTRYLNARSTLHQLLSLGVIPIVNENDTVACDELRFGDNDTLAALVANLVEANVLVILTDQTGLFNKDPRQHKDAALLEDVQAGDPSLQAMASSHSSSGLGRGGMSTKVQAADLAARSGTTAWVASGREPDILQRMAGGESLGTRFHPSREPLLARKQWLAGHLQVKGEITLDAGAVRVLKQSGRSLLPVGVVAASGAFKRGEVVNCRSTEGENIARGLVNYGADEVQKILGKPSEQIEALLGYVDEPELIHRDNLVLL